MKLVNVHKDKEQPNERITRVLSDEEYDKEREYLLSHYTITVYDGEGELIDDNT